MWFYEGEDNYIPGSVIGSTNFPVELVQPLCYPDTTDKLWKREIWFPVIVLENLCEYQLNDPFLYMTDQVPQGEWFVFQIMLNFLDLCLNNIQSFVCRTCI